MANLGLRPAALPVDGIFTFGQIFIRPLGNGKFQLSHRDEADRTDGLEAFFKADDAIELARLDDAGNYRPLKTAPNLRHGWRFDVTSVSALYRALDFFYPGRLAMVRAREQGDLITTPIRETLDRQSGMYRVAASISDQQLDDVIGRFCRSNGGCLRTILWERDPSGTVPSTKLPPQKFDPGYDQALDNGAIPVNAVNVPLLCQEACNLLVAECRRVVKAR